MARKKPFDEHGARGERHEHRGGQVVSLAVHEDEKRRHEDDRECAELSVRTEGLPDESRYPQKSVQGSEVVDLGQQKANRTQRHVLQARGVAYEFDGRPMVAELPQDMGSDESQHEADGEPRRTCSEIRTQWRQHERRRDAHSQGAYAELVEQADAQDDAQVQPEPRARRLVGTAEASRSRMATSQNMKSKAFME